MKKNKHFICINCKTEYIKWQGSCTSCGQWSTIEEIKQTTVSFEDTLIKLNDFDNENLNKINIGINEFDRVLGGGFIKGSSVLLSGEPGIGKSTLILQLAGKLSEKNLDIIYITAEESLNQLIHRAKRLKIHSENIQFFQENNVTNILNTCENLKPEIIIIDSVQTVYSPDSESTTGSVSQVRKISELACMYSRTNNAALFLIGQVTKSGDLAGPRSLEHLVDVVISLEGDRKQSYRILRASKNRYGSCEEIGIFKMFENGLEEIQDLSQLFISRNEEILPAGIVRGSVIDGNRNFIVEVEALTVTTRYGVPARVVNFFNQRRLSMLIAVLNKWAGIDLSNIDVYCNIAGNTKVVDTSLDLPVCIAIVSSLYKIKFPVNFLAIGEVALSGELRNVDSLSNRIKEAIRLGYDKILIPKIKGNKLKKNIIEAKTISNVLKIIKGIKC